MNVKQVVKKWFDDWSKGDFQQLSISDNFTHTSPFGTIAGKETYLKTVDENRDKFLGYTFEIHDEIYAESKACVRYTAIQGDFTLDVSEWLYISKDNLIEKIISYYHIGEIRDERKLSNTNKKNQI